MLVRMYRSCKQEMGERRMRGVWEATRHRGLWDEELPAVLLETFNLVPEASMPSNLICIDF